MFNHYHYYLVRAVYKLVTTSVIAIHAELENKEISVMSVVHM